MPPGVWAVPIVEHLVGAPLVEHLRTGWQLTVRGGPAAICGGASLLGLGMVAVASSQIEPAWEASKAITPRASTRERWGTHMKDRAVLGCTGPPAAEPPVNAENPLTERVPEVGSTGIEPVTPRV
jgi:hypothetical protein